MVVFEEKYIWPGLGHAVYNGFNVCSTVHPEHLRNVSILLCYLIPLKALQND